MPLFGVTPPRAEEIDIVSDMTQSSASGPSGPSRRALLKGAAIGAGALWIAPVIDSFASPAAAASGVALGVELKKDDDGTVVDRCLQGCSGPGCSPAGRGTVNFVRTENPPTMTVTVSLSTGTAIVGRVVYILQTNGVSCLSSAVAGNWTSTTRTQTFSAPIVPGATRFVVHTEVSGGGGNDIYTSLQAVLP